MPTHPNRAAAEGVSADAALASARHYQKAYRDLERSIGRVIQFGSVASFLAEMMWEDVKRDGSMPPNETLIDNLQFVVNEGEAAARALEDQWTAAWNAGPEFVA